MPGLLRASVRHTEGGFAIDLGAIAMGDKTTPKVYLDPDAFFAATYVTTDLFRLLEEVLASLAGIGTFNRVLKLRSPFGGGKSHTLASLLHAGRSRKSLNQIAECKSLADPGKVHVAVFDGEKFTATGDKDVGGGQMVHTMWGWLAWQLGPKAYKAVQKHDIERVSPAGDEIKDMLEAEGKSPVTPMRFGNVLKSCWKPDSQASTTQSFGLQRLRIFRTKSRVSLSDICRLSSPASLSRSKTRMPARCCRNMATGLALIGMVSP